MLLLDWPIDATAAAYESTEVGTGGSADDECFDDVDDVEAFDMLDCTSGLSSVVDFDDNEL